MRCSTTPFVMTTSLVFITILSLLLLLPTNATVTTNGSRQLRNTKENTQRNLSSIATTDCTLQVEALLRIPGETLPNDDEDEILFCEFDSMVDDGDLPTNGDFVSTKKKKVQYQFDFTDTETKQQFKQDFKDGKLIPNQSVMNIQGLKILNGDKIVIPKGWEWKEEKSNNGVGNDISKPKLRKLHFDDKPTDSHHQNNNSHRQLNDLSTGVQNFLVVRITDINGKVRGESAAEISSDVFGSISGYTDTVNMKSQLESCSHDKLIVVPGGIASHENRYTAPGVVDITIPVDITTSSRDTIREEAEQATANYLESSLNEYDHILYIIQECYVDCGWAAFARVNGQYSVYQGLNYKFVGVQVHELG